MIRRVRGSSAFEAIVGIVVIAGLLALVLMTGRAREQINDKSNTTGKYNSFQTITYEGHKFIIPRYRITPEFALHHPGCHCQVQTPEKAQ